MYKLAFVLTVAIVAAGFVAAPAEAKKVHAPADSLCSICGFVVNVVENWIQGNTTEQQIMTYLDKVCGYLGSFSEECTSWVNSEIPAMIQLLIEKETPAVLCARWCANSTANAVKPVEKGTHNKPAGCPACRVAADIVARAKQQQHGATLTTAAVAPLFRQQCVATLGDQDQCRTFEKTQLGAMISFVKGGQSASRYCALHPTC